MRKTYKFKLYNSKKNKKSKHQLWVACKIYNHCIALHKRYWKLYHKSLNKNKLQKHLVKLKKLEKFAYWNELPSHAIQDITDMLDIMRKVVGETIYDIVNPIEECSMPYKFSVNF